MIAQIVPVLRLRRDTSWWSYIVPPRQSVLPGSLVVVPFRGRPTLGIVWSVDEQDGNATESLSEVLCRRPLVTAPHRKLIEYLSEAGLCSLSTALYTWLPAGLRSLSLTRQARSFLAAFAGSTPDLTKRQHAVLVPGQRPYQEHLLREKFADKFSPLFSAAEGEELERWFAIAQGDTQVGLGREAALFAPWSNLQQVTVIEPEDIGYYHEQTPYLPMVQAARVLAEAANARFQVKSWLPEETVSALWQAEQGNVPTHAAIRDLRREPILNAELVSDISTALDAGKRALILLNARDRIKVGPSNERTLVPGIETLRKKLAHQLNRPLDPGITFDTRSALHADLGNLGHATVLLADTVLDAGTFADTLHGISDICHLLSLNIPVTVQTYQPEHPLIAGLRNGTLPLYLSACLDEQKEALLPPFGSVIACSYPGSEEQAALAVHEKLTALTDTAWEIGHPFVQPWRKKQFVHIVLQAPRGSRVPIQLRRFLVQLPRPWRIQRDPWYLA